MDSDDAPYEVHMHQSDALELVKSGAILLILDMPANSSFGFNTQMFLVGPNFKGVKMLLPGPHFVYYSARSKHGGDSSPVTGFFIHASASQVPGSSPGCGSNETCANDAEKVIVRKWDPREERLVKLSDSSEEERFALAARNMEFDRQLAPYDLDRHKIWQSLTNFISPTVIERIEPLDGDISVMAEASLVQHAPRTPAEKRLYEQISKRKKQQGPEVLSNVDEGNGNGSPSSTSNSTEGQGKKESSGRCSYTHLPHLIKRSGMSGSELTAMNIDKSQALESILRKNYDGQEELLLGELQFCFVAFLMGQSLEAFGQWKGIVSLLLRCEEGPLRTRTTFFIKFLGVIYWQLKQSLQPDVKGPNDSLMLMDDGWLADDNFFRLLLKEGDSMLLAAVDGQHSSYAWDAYRKLQKFSKQLKMNPTQCKTSVVETDFLNMLRDATPVNGELLRQVKRLKKLFETTMGWIFDMDSVVGEEDDEYAPVIVYEEDCTMGEATQT